MGEMTPAQMVQVAVEYGVLGAVIEDETVGRFVLYYAMQRADWPLCVERKRRSLFVADTQQPR